MLSSEYLDYPVRVDNARRRRSVRLPSSPPKPYLVLTFVVAGCLTGCASFRPVPLQDVPFLDRAQTETHQDTKVTIAVPSATETRQLFDSKLYKKRIQPIWVEVENLGDGPAWVFAYTIDPNYFPPLEAAWKSHRTWAGAVNRRIDTFFHEQALPSQVRPGETVSGYVFVELNLGTRHVPLAVFNEDGWRKFEFIVKVPGFRADHTSVDFQDLYRAEEFITLETEEDLRKWVEALPCCTTDKKGIRSGDPLNFVLVASDEAFVSGMVRAGWDETASLTTGTALRTGIAAVFGRSYRYAPISPLYVLDRPQDIGLQKARWNVHQRNHLRLWLAPARYGDRFVWIGQISRDIGSRLTSRSSTFTTHKIDPDVDEARDFLILDLVNAQALESFAYAAGVGPAPTASPHKNLTGDPYFTDGRRAVLFLSVEPTSLTDVDFLEWGAPADEAQP